MIIDGECHVEAEQVHQLNKQPCCSHSNKRFRACVLGIAFEGLQAHSRCSYSNKSLGARF